jgi:hypothetical protein
MQRIHIKFLAGILMGLWTLIACGEETKTCDEWVDQYIYDPHEADAESMLVCDGIGDLEPMGDMQLTEEQFQHRQSEVQDEIDDLFTEFETDGPEW